MAKHKFEIGLIDQNGATMGAQCARCYQIAMLVNGRLPDEILEQECPTKCEDLNQAARSVSETTK